ncbi:hypothetical protein [Aliirhizobium smilacinae]|uniref:Uncharacterized protein n=1 Tax=Aliirhizobium smilacinae TaxID=1395944 RepID=A0A5C4XFR8_9HYPH|nr:hypothetical protein [Rhizobium smilacinae]TNM62192.1 hypothetical protein FHP24_19070 [Rhizobium smilacinae]
MALIGFKNTHNQEVYVNPAQILYVMPFEEGVTIVTFAVLGSAGQPHTIYVRGGIEQVRQRLGAKA